MDYGFNAALSLIVKSALPGDNAYAGAKLELDRSEAGLHWILN